MNFRQNTPPRLPQPAGRPLQPQTPAQASQIRPVYGVANPTNVQAQPPVQGQIRMPPVQQPTVPPMQTAQMPRQNPPGSPPGILASLGRPAMRRG